MRRTAHLSDDQILGLCLDEVASPSTRAHVETCSACAARQTELSRLLADVSATTRAEADAAFSPQHLQRQQARILQRIERIGRTATIVSFPAGHARSVPPARPRSGMRWVAGAAAAGLIIGLLAGEYRREVWLVNPAAGAFSAGPQTVSNLQAVSAAMSEEEFLSRLELVIDGTGGPTLQPLHDLTPLVWEVAAQ